MRTMLITLALLAVSASTALAQSSPAAPGPQQPAAARQPAATAPAQPASRTPAQQWSLDHGHAEDGAKAVASAVVAKAAAPASAAPAANFVVNGSAVIAAAPARTVEQRQADAEAQSAWQTRCRPAVAEDRDGMRRIKYAETDCDLSRFNTAGVQ
jgi:hypothetical protein